MTGVAQAAPLHPRFTVPPSSLRIPRRSWRPVPWRRWCDATVAEDTDGGEHDPGDPGTADADPRYDPRAAGLPARSRARHRRQLRWTPGIWWPGTGGAVCRHRGG